MTVTLETRRLRLRPWREADVEPLHGFYLDPESAKVYGSAIARHDVWRRVACFIGHWQLRGFGLWALEEKASGRFVGYSGLWFPEEFADVEVGWGIVAGHRGKGYATEAARRAQSYGFGEAGLTELVSYILPGNRASIQVAERVGAAPAGEVMLHGKTHVVYRHPKPETSVQ